MRYEGAFEVIARIEHQIKNNAMAFERKGPKDDELFGVKSIVTTRVFDVLIPKEAFIFPVRLFYDGRNATGCIDVRDKDVSWLCRVCPEMLKLIALLEPRKLDNNEKVSR